MLKQWLMLISVCWAISSVTQAVILNEEDAQDLIILQKLVTPTEKIWDNTKALFKEEFNQELKQWFYPSKEKFAQLVKLSEDPNSSWPTENFSTSLSSLISSSSQNVSKANTQEIVNNMTAEELSKGLYHFIAAVNKRKENGNGLTAKDQIHAKTCFTKIKILDEWLKELLLRLEDSKKITTKFAFKLSELESKLFQASLEKESKSSKPSPETDVSQDEFTKTNLFHKAGLYVYEMNLNTLGNFMWLYALIYKDLGDNSLEKKFLTEDQELLKFKSAFNSKTPKKVIF